MGKHYQSDLRIEGMHCAGCVQSIEKELRRVPGVSECQVNLVTKSATVVYNAETTDEKGIIGAIEKLGYRAGKGSEDILTSNRKEETTARNRFQISLLFTVPLMILTMWPQVSGKYLFSSLWDSVAAAGLAAVVLFLCGRSILQDAARQTSHFRANMNSLIAMGTMTAFCWSGYILATSLHAPHTGQLYFDSAGMIISLILLGRYLEAKSKSKAGEAVKALLSLQPTTAVAIINGVEVEIDAATVRARMTLLVKPGERLAADGNIIEGSPVVDESMLTGESLPVDKKPGDTVVGGSVNGNTSFRFTVTAAGEDSFMANIGRLISQAQTRKAPVQRLADRVAGVFVPIVIGTALLTFAVWYWLDSNNPLMIKSVISVLIIACPCALGLATPTAVLAGTGRAAREGIIIRGGDILESITRLDAITPDKTGTLTHGEFEVTVLTALGGMSEKDLTAIAGSAEAHSEHLLAGAIVRFMEQQEVEPVKVEAVEAMPGSGIRGMYDGRPLLIGNRALMDREKVNLAEILPKAEKEMKEGRTTVFVALEGKLVGLISLADRLRSDARDVIKPLKLRLQRVAMLSGDTYLAAARVARSVGLDDFEAGVKPDQKQLVVESYRKSGYCVAMVGDGINDAPALTAADVGVAIGSGTDVAIEAADVVLVRSELSAILKMFDIAQTSMRIIKQNLFWAFSYNIVAIPLAAGLFYPLFGWTLSPMIAAAMAFSSVLVVTNSLRLNRLRLD